MRPVEKRTKVYARSLLTGLSRNVDTTDEEGRGDDLKLDMANLFQELKT